MLTLLIFICKMQTVGSFVMMRRIFQEYSESGSHFPMHIYRGSTIWISRHESDILFDWKNRMRFFYCFHSTMKQYLTCFLLVVKCVILWENLKLWDQDASVIFSFPTYFPSFLGEIVFRNFYLIYFVQLCIFRVSIREKGVKSGVSRRFALINNTDMYGVQWLCWGGILVPSGLHQYWPR
jgi:hypothetical protein